MVNKTKIIGLLLLLYSFLAYSQVCEQAKKLLKTIYIHLKNYENMPLKLKILTKFSMRGRYCTTKT